MHITKVLVSLLFQFAACAYSAPEIAVAQFSVAAAWALFAFQIVSPSILVIVPLTFVFILSYGSNNISILYLVAQWLTVWLLLPSHAPQDVSLPSLFLFVLCAALTTVVIFYTSWGWWYVPGVIHLYNSNQVPKTLTTTMQFASAIGYMLSTQYSFAISSIMWIIILCGMFF